MRSTMLLGWLFPLLAGVACGGAPSASVSDVEEANFQCRVKHRCDGGTARPSGPDAGLPIADGGDGTDAGTVEALCSGSPTSFAESLVSGEFDASGSSTLEKVSGGASSVFLTYYDVPAYVPYADRVLVNAGAGNALRVVAMTPEGDAAQTLLTFDPCAGGLPGYQMSADGRMLVYAKQNEGGLGTCDLYGLRIDRAGSCAAQEKRLTHLELAAGLQVEVSPPTLEVSSGHYVAAFGVNPGKDAPHLYVVRDDGANPRSPTQAGPLDVKLDDVNRSFGWHRVRMNPVFAHLVFYRREAPAGAPSTQEYYLVDWSSSDAPHAVQWCDHCAGSHPTWTPDGQRTAIDGSWTEFSLVGPQGSILPGLGIVAPDHGRVVGPFGQNGVPHVMYGSYSPDGKEVLVVTTPLQDSHGGQVFAMNAATGAIKQLCDAHSGFTLIKGQPRLRFVRGTAAVAFSSDDAYRSPGSGVPEVFLLGALGALP